jgi:anti-anti-sigma factor
MSMELVMADLAGRVTHLKLTGRLDAPGVDRIDLRFTAAVVTHHRPTVVDLSEVGFIASMGLRLFIATARSAKIKGIRVVLFGAQGMVREVLEQASLDQIVDIVETEARALDRAVAV